MNKYLTDFISECEKRLEMYRADSSNESLFNLEHDLKKKAWSKISNNDIPDGYKDKTYSELIIIIDHVISKEIGESIYYGAKNFQFYIEQLSKDNELRWHTEKVSGKYVLILQQKHHYWVQSARVNTLFNSIDEVKEYLSNLLKKTGVSLPLETGV